MSKETLPTIIQKLAQALDIPAARLSLTEQELEAMPMLQDPEKLDKLIDTIQDKAAAGEYDTLKYILVSEKKVLMVTQFLNGIIPSQGGQQG